MLARIIDAHDAALLDRKPARAGKEGVAQVVLRASRVGLAEFGGPPLAGGVRSGDEQARLAAAALRLRLRGERGLAIEEAGEVVAERIDAEFEALVEHVADHDHAAVRPLSHA